MTLEKFEENFRRVISSSKFGRSEIAAALGCKMPNIEMRTSKNNLYVKNVFAIAELLNIPVARFFDDSFADENELQILDSQIKELEKKKKSLLMRVRKEA